MSDISVLRSKLESHLTEYKAEIQRLKAIAEQRALDGKAASAEAKLNAQAALDVFSESLSEAQTFLSNVNEKQWAQSKAGMIEAWEKLKTSFEDAKQRLNQ